MGSWEVITGEKEHEVHITDKCSGWTKIHWDPEECSGEKIGFSWSKKEKEKPSIRYC